MSALQTLVNADHALFRALNARWTCGLLDAFMPWLTDLNRHPLFWVAAALAGAVWFARDRRGAAVGVPAIGLAVGATDVFCRAALKPLFHRLRPEYVLSGVVLRAGTHSRYGFPSNHAANCFAGAVVLGSLYPRWRLPALAAAALVGYSRVYVGAHFPLDVLGGAAVGAAIGGLAALGACRLRSAITRPAASRV